MGMHSLNSPDGDEPRGRHQRQQNREKPQRAHAAVAPRPYPTRAYSHTGCTLPTLHISRNDMS